jgi:hypothetical protein
MVVAVVAEHVRLEAVGGPVILQCLTMNGAAKQRCT